MNIGWAQCESEVVHCTPMAVGQLPGDVYGPLSNEYLPLPIGWAAERHAWFRKDKAQLPEKYWMINSSHSRQSNIQMVQRLKE